MLSLTSFVALLEDKSGLIVAILSALSVGVSSGGFIGELDPREQEIAVHNKNN
jgi:hypothetical protein